MAYGHVFATVGTTQFDLFISTLLSEKILTILKKKGYGSITMQIGSGTVIPDKQHAVEGIVINYYRYKDSIIEDMKAADLVISHAGAGSCLEALDLNKPLLVVVNEDLMDNHQLELAEQLNAGHHAYYTVCSELEQTLEQMDITSLQPFPKADPVIFLKLLDDILGFQKKK